MANDIVCLAVAPILVESCQHRGYKPIPFLLALACASNVGSAATLIGNPQNMLIGQALAMSFAGYLLIAIVPTILGLLVVWWIIARSVHGEWSEARAPIAVEAPRFNPWQSAKGLGVITLLVLAFLFTPWPREALALGAAGLLLTSRKMASRKMLALVDWQLLVLFVGLFVVNHALAQSGVLVQATTALTQGGLDPSQPAALYVVTPILSNLVSNVPAVMLLLPVATHPLAGPILALSSTLAGNLFIVGSIANIIVVDQARPLGVHIGFREHARIGVPVALATLAVAGAWLWVVSQLR